MTTTQESLDIAEDAREKRETYQSFASKLFMGKLDLSFIFPFPKQTPEEKKAGDDYIKKLNAFLLEHLDPDEVDKTYEIPQKVIDGLKEMGAFALKVPKKYGGQGFSVTNYNRIVMQVASYCGATAVLLSAHQSIGVPQPLKMFGTEEQKQRIFPRFAKGDISAFALTEVDVGSDPARMTTEAHLSKDGSHYILNGEKLWCTNGAKADIIIVMAQTAPKMIKGKERKQISAFILDMKSEGIKIVHRCDFMGLHGIYNAMISFKDVKIPVENLLDKEGRGLAMALATINIGRLTLPAASAAVAKQCLKVSRTWGKERVQWGQAIGFHEPGSEKISYIAATTFAMEAMTWLTSKWADENKMDIRIEAAMAKLFCTEELWTIIDMTMQLRGGRGYETATSLKKRGEPGIPVERMMRDCRINTILEGTSEIMKLFLAREALDPHLEKLKSLMKAKGSHKISAFLRFMTHFALWYPKQCIPNAIKLPQNAPSEALKHTRSIERYSRKLAKTLFTSMMRYQKGLEHKQLRLGRLMDIGTDLFAMSCTLSYWLSDDEGKYSDVATHFLGLAQQRIENNFRAIHKNTDDTACALAQSILKGDHTWLEEGVISVDY